MITIKLIYVDEEKDQHDDFKASFDKVQKQLTDCKFEVITLFPEENLDIMIDKILSQYPDAVVTDFKLNEKKDSSIKYEVDYDGSELRDKIESIKSEFPCFVSSSYFGEAVSSHTTHDVSKVYSKAFDIYDVKINKNHLTLHEVIKLQVEKYRLYINQVDVEFQKLIAEREIRSLSSSEEIKLLELDSILEASLNKIDRVPLEFKTTTNAQTLNNLIHRIDLLIEKVDSNAN